MNFLNINLLKKKAQALSLFSFILIPISTPNQFLDLKYNKIKPNIVTIKKNISIEVNSSASPLFYKLEKKAQIDSIEFSGHVSIQNPITDFKNDSYFQFGLIYKGDYKPGFLTRSFLPDWLIKVLDLDKKSGIGDIYFYEASADGVSKSSSDKISDINIFYQSATSIKNGQFKAIIKPKKGEILGFWLRSDGDESKAKFKTFLTNLEVNFIKKT